MPSSAADGRYRSVAENLQVKEVVLGDGERRTRYAVCFNPQEAQRQKAHREQIVREIEAELQSLRYIPEEGHTKRVCELRASARYGRFLKDTDAGLLLDRKKVEAAERFDGNVALCVPQCSNWPAAIPTSGTVKLLLPPRQSRQSRGASPGS